MRLPCMINTGQSCERRAYSKMSGHRKFSELTKGFTPEDRQHIEAVKSEMRAAMELSEPAKVPAPDSSVTPKTKPAKAD